MADVSQEHAPPGTCRVAAVQLNSGDRVDANLDRIESLLGEAKARGCRVAMLPENCAFVAMRDEDRLAVAEPCGSGPIQARLADIARRLELQIVAGSLPLTSDDPGRASGATVVFGRDGRIEAVYRKLHLFDVDIPERDESYRESAFHAPGTEVVTADSEAGVLGLTICYDLRFPELYRRLAQDGATVFSIPAAFTDATGKAHWEPLLRARAIENLAWVVAAAQHGRHPNGRRTWGHTMIVDPWGRIVASLAAGEGLVTADIDHRYTARLRRIFPVLEHRRL